MANLNSVYLIGRLGQTPELKRTRTDAAYLRLSVATSEKIKEKEKTTWHSVVVWGKLAEILAPMLKAGQSLHIHGSLDHREWDQDGEKHKATEIKADTVQIL